MLLAKIRELGRLASLVWYGVLWVALGINYFFNSCWGLLPLIIWPWGFVYGLWNLWPGVYEPYYRFRPDLWVGFVVAFPVGLAVAWMIGGRLHRTWMGEQNDRVALFTLSFFVLYAALFVVNLSVHFIGLWSGVGSIIE